MVDRLGATGAHTDIRGPQEVGDAQLSFLLPLVLLQEVLCGLFHEGVKGPVEINGEVSQLLQEIGVEPDAGLFLFNLFLFHGSV